MAQKDPFQDWRGVDKALKDLRDIVGDKKARSVVNRSLMFAVGKASPLAKMARAMAPVRRDYSGGIKRTHKGNIKIPGYLSRHLEAKLIPKGSKVLFGPTSEAFYGTQFLEKGIGKSGSHGPWLEPAFAATKEATFKRFIDRLAQNIEKARTKTK
jgi:hypothetical protein